MVLDLKDETEDLKAGDLIITDCGQRFVCYDKVGGYMTIDLRSGNVINEFESLEQLKNFYIIIRVIAGEKLALTLKNE